MTSRLAVDGDVAVAHPALLRLALLHRATLRDIDRLATFVERLAVKDEPGDDRPVRPRRWRALARAVDRLCLEIRDHHLAQEVWLWPQLDRWAPAAADLSGLGNDHTALFSCLDTVRRVNRRGPGQGRMDGRDGRGARRLVSSLRELAELLAEHAVEEEQETLTILAAHLPRGRRCVAGGLVATGGALRTFPRLLTVASHAEAATVTADLGGARAALLPALVARHRRHERRLVEAGEGRG